MMNIPPSEADRLDLQTYEMILHNWNETHSTEDEVEMPPLERTMSLIDKINSTPALLN